MLRALAALGFALSARAAGPEAPRGPCLAAPGCASEAGEADDSALLQQRRGSLGHRQSSSKKFQRLRISRVRASGAQSPRSSERVAVTGFFGGGVLLVNISLGSDAREVPVNIDLGSGPLWVPTTSATCCSVQGVCATCQAKGKPGHEFSAKPLTNFTSTYGVGNVTGAAYVEKVQVGDLPGFEIIMGGADLLYQFSGFFGSPMEGLMGLGLAYLNEGRTDPSVNIWEMSTIIMMWKQDVIDSPVFTLSLHGGDDDGELILGRVDSSQIDAEFFWTPVVKPISPDAGAPNYPFQNVFGFWSFSVNSFAIGDTRLDRTAVAILDSGASVIAIEKDIHDEWRALTSRAVGSDILLVPLEGTSVSVVVVPCSDLDKVPSLSFTAGGQTWTIDAGDMAIDDPALIDNLFSMNSAPPSLPIGSCVLVLVDLVPPGYGAILGTPFLQKYVTAFDATPNKEQLAIAKKKTSKPAPAPTPAPAPAASCFAGQGVRCPGAGNMCAGNQCCGRTESSGHRTFPCPSADDVVAAGCETQVKVEDCLN